MDPILAKIFEQGAVPIMDVDGPLDAGAIEDLVGSGSLSCIELLVHDRAGIEAVKVVAEACQATVVGCGGVVTADQVDAASEAGARFVTGPGLDQSIARQARQRGIVYLPGCGTPAELVRASTLELEAIQIVPADGRLAPALVTGLAAHVPWMRLMPVGDIGPADLEEYLRPSQILAVGFTRPAGEVKAKADPAAVVESIRRVVRSAHGFAVAHVGVSTAGAAEAEAVARRFGALFGFEVRLGNSSNFASAGIEVMKGRSRGTCGHVAIGTTSITRAVAFLGSQGINFVAGSEKSFPDGSLKAIYLDEEVGGFAVHLIQERQG